MDYGDESLVCHVWHVRNGPQLNDAGERYDDGSILHSYAFTGMFRLFFFIFYPSKSHDEGGDGDGDGDGGEERREVVACERQNK